MNALGIVGVILIVFGAVVLALGGISYVRERDEMQVGPIEVAAEKREFIPPVAGLVAAGAGLVLVLVGRRSRA